MINDISSINIPDLGTGINKVNDVRDKTLRNLDSINAGEEKASFKDMLKDFIGDVNTMQKKADDSVNRLASGEITDVHDVMIKVEEANLSFSLMMEIRNKIVEGYKEVLRTNV
ncbi:MAG: flagellar hook-basal body complex protein FliE [Candidatus Delongbacteria bacterium]|nr:flagellar hook-basal body complex protein FliE [Candidatus Delongbacteria bacterium]MBN2835786.1 flagellar hook-basal body complex protein FliE [Candidatus Delongbacteria bacterium]